MATQKILIVDDSKTIRMQIKDMLPHGNFEVLEAADGLEGLDVITHERPNLVLLDFFMPRMNGWEVVQKLQEHPKFNLIPVVMMSGRREDVEKTVPELFTYFEFLGKPFEADLLIKAIRSASSKAKQRVQVMPAHPVKDTAEPVSMHSTATEAKPDAETDAIAILTQQVEQLQHQNQHLAAELNSIKKQMAQLIAVVRQKITAA